MKTIKFGNYVINICESTKEFLNNTHNKKGVVSVEEYNSETGINTYWFDEEKLGENLKHNIISSVISNEMINSEDMETEENIFIRAHEVTKWIMEIL